MDAGHLDRRITLQSPTVAKNEFFEDVTTWTDLATVWAARWTLRVAEVERQGKREAGAEFKFMIRWRGDLAPTMRVMFEGSPYEVTGIEEIGRREGLNLFVRGLAL